MSSIPTRRRTSGSVRLPALIAASLQLRLLRGVSKTPQKNNAHERSCWNADLSLALLWHVVEASPAFNNLVSGKLVRTRDRPHSLRFPSFLSLAHAPTHQRTRTTAHAHTGSVSLSVVGTQANVDALHFRHCQRVLTDPIFRGIAWASPAIHTLVLEYVL
jgi:hypothetical protein